MDGSGSQCHDRAGIGAALPPLPLPRKPALRAAIADDLNPDRTTPYDLLRTRILPEITEHGWTRIGLAQARPGHAAALTALNLALSEARRPDRRVLLVDLDLAAQPVLTRLGQTAPAATEPSFLMRALTPQVACLTVAAPPRAAAITLLSPQFQIRLDEQILAHAPDLTILNLPPLLAGDAGLAAMPLVQTVMLVIDGRRDTAAMLRRCEGHVTRHCPLLGLFLHNAEG